MVVVVESIAYVVRYMQQMTLVMEQEAQELKSKRPTRLHIPVEALLNQAALLQILYWSQARRCTNMYMVKIHGQSKGQRHYCSRSQGWALTPSLLAFVLTKLANSQKVQLKRLGLLTSLEPV